MERNKLSILFFMVLLAGSIFFFAESAYADNVLSGPSYCCEKTTEGAFCVNSDKDKCDPNFKSSPTSCESTSYCKLGTCYDSSEGICMENTPQNVCNENGGTWDGRLIEEVPQCQLGCCIIGDQAAFVPLVRCKKLSTFYGVSIDYRKDIQSEVSCIATAQSQDMGACVYEEDFERICEFTTRGDCGAGEKVEEVNGSEIKISSDRKFYKDFLCSAEELNTACAKQKETSCYQGKVYWQDSCGNRENVYSSDKEKSWNGGRVAESEEICAANDGSNRNCGNCDYLLGSRCAENDNLVNLGGVDNYCKRTECVDREGQKRVNGESWCVADSYVGDGLDPVGQRYYREICVDGQVRVEPCADFRNEVCFQGSIETSKGSFGTAGCRVNRWQDCVLQTESDDCLNVARRDCIWVSKVNGMIVGGGGTVSSTGGATKGFTNPTASSSSGGFTNPTANVIAPLGGGITGQAVLGRAGDDIDDSVEGVCVPQFSPGLKFWDSASNSGNVCGLASARCVVTETESVAKGKSEKNEECLTNEWAAQADRVCASLGDCGGYININDDYTDDGFEWAIDGHKQELSPNTVNKIKGGFTGLLIKEISGKEIEE